MGCNTSTSRVIRAPSEYCTRMAWSPAWSQRAAEDAHSLANKFGVARAGLGASGLPVDSAKFAVGCQGLSHSPGSLAELAVATGI